MQLTQRDQTEIHPLERQPCVTPLPPQQDSQPQIADQLRRILELDHLHVVLFRRPEGEGEAAGVLASTWPAAIKALALSENWHGGDFFTAARSASRVSLKPDELRKIAGQTGKNLQSGLFYQLSPHWLFSVPERGGLAGEIWVGRFKPLSPQEEGVIASLALPLVRSLSARYQRASGRPRRLTPREVQCLRCASEGRTSEEIARLLAIAPTTVETHFKHATAKLNANNRSHAVAEAIRSGTIT